MSKSFSASRGTQERILMRTLPASQSRFQNIYLFHDRGGSPDGAVLNLEAILQHAFYDVKFWRPDFPHRDLGVKAEESLDYAILQYRKEIIPNSLIVGIGLGGLIAAKLQELSPHLNLSVITLMSPMHAGVVSLEEKNKQRIAFYSKEDPEALYHSDWPFAETFDLPMLRYHEINNCKYAICYLIVTYIQGKGLTEAVNNLFPPNKDFVTEPLNLAKI